MTKSKNKKEKQQQTVTWLHQETDTTKLNLNTY